MVRASCSPSTGQECIRLNQSLTDKAFVPSAGQEAPNRFAYALASITPGAFGPTGGESRVILVISFISVVVTCLAIILTSGHQEMMDAEVDAGTTQPNDFAIMVRGLPKDATDESRIQAFFKKHAVKDQEDTEIVKVVIGWDFSEFKSKMDQLKQLRATQGQLEAGDPHIQEIAAEIATITKELESAAPDKASRLRSTGIAVVILRKQTDHRKCLARWTSRWSRWFGRDYEDFCCFAGIWPGAKLPMFPNANDEPMWPIAQIQRAANPGDIHWEELGIEFSETFKRFLKTNALMALFVVIAFFLVFGMAMLKSVLEEEQEEAEGDMGTALQFVSFLPTLIIMVSNVGLAVAANVLGKYEIHESWTTQEFSQAAKMAVGMCINTGLVSFVANAQPPEWYRQGGLTNVVISMLALNFIVPPLLQYMDMPYKTKWRQRSKAENAIPQINEVLRKGKPTDKASMEAFQFVQMQLQGFKKAFEPSMLNNARRYANALKTFVCAALYMPMFPAIAGFAIIGLILQYKVDKYLITQWFKRPARPQNMMMAHFSLDFVKFVVPIGISGMYWIFLTPSWKNKSETSQSFILSLFPIMIIYLVPLKVLRTCLFTRCIFSRTGLEVADDSGEDYYKAQFMWSKDMKYHHDQFLYKKLPASQNPEFFKPGVDNCTNGAEAFKPIYGVAAAQAAADAGHQKDDVGIKGANLSEGVGSVTAGSGIGTASGAAPTVYGITTTDVPDPGVAQSSGIMADNVPLVASSDPDPIVPTPAPAPAAAPAPAPAPAPKPSRSSAKPVWECEGKHQWSAMNSDTQDYMEKMWRKYKDSGGRNHFNVTSKQEGGFTLSIDFKKMSSKKEGGHKIMNIRRVPEE